MNNELFVYALVWGAKRRTRQYYVDPCVRVYIQIAKIMLSVSASDVRAAQCAHTHKKRARIRKGARHSTHAHRALIHTLSLSRQPSLSRLSTHTEIRVHTRQDMHSHRSQDSV